jgi:hypothetical protein
VTISLPQRAGKLFALVHEAFWHAYDTARGDKAIFSAMARAHTQPAAVFISKGDHHPIQVRAIACPEPDVDGLVRIVLEFARQMGEEDERKDGLNARKNLKAG